MARRAALLAALVAACPASAAAAPVVVMGPGGHVSTRNDPYLTGPPVTPPPATALTPPPATALTPPPATALTPRPATAAPRSAPRPRRRAITVPVALSRLLHAGAIAPSAYASYAASFRSAANAVRRLRGTRARELRAVIANLNRMAATGSLTASRLPVLFQTLDHNRQWWVSGPLLTQWQRVEFTGSQLVWEYYPGQGIELQVLGNFAKADGLYTAGRAQYSNLVALLGELIPLAVNRAGGLAWEYYFNFDGGAPPWVSAMSQGTALEALSRAYKATGQQSYLDLGHRALGLFGAAPPAGVRIATPLGARYLQYSFAPHTDIVNAFLQSLIGLYDFAQVSGDLQATQLFAAGDAQARAEVPAFDTGAWSLYQPGVEDDLSYHELVTGFLEQLCSRTQASVYCTAAQHFSTYTHTLPTLALLTHRAPRRKPFALRFSLSKYSHVGVVVTRGSQTVLSTSASFPYGRDSFRVPAVKRPGAYAVRLAATDLAGNFARIVDTVTIS